MKETNEMNGSARIRRRKRGQSEQSLARKLPSMPTMRKNTLVNVV
jgi:hypothetical protein